MIKDERGQFTIAGLFALFLMLLVTLKLMPFILDTVGNISTQLEKNGYTVEAWLIKLVPASIIISILSSIYFYAKPLILRKEE